MLRNVVAHHGFLPAQNDFDRVVVSFKDWRLQVGDKWQGAAEQDHELARLMRRPGQVAPTQPAF